MKEFVENPLILPVLLIFTVLWIRLNDHQKPNHLNFDSISIQKMALDADKFFKN
jgi:hypothetical protein